jgi:hypothetical protein
MSNKIAADRLGDGRKIRISTASAVPPVDEEIEGAVATAEPEVPQHLLNAVTDARTRYTSAAEDLAESRQVVERVAAFLNKRIAQRAGVRTSQKAGARAAVLAAGLEAFVSDELERVRVEVGQAGRFASADFRDVELLAELVDNERGAQPALILACAESAAAVLTAQADVFRAYVEAHRLQSLQLLLPVWARDREAIRLDTSKDGVSHLSKFEAQLRAEAGRILDHCQAARQAPVVTGIDVAFWAGNELENWDAKITYVLRDGPQREG